MTVNKISAIKFSAIICLIISSLNLKGQTTSSNPWYIEKFNSMSLDEKIGQFFMVAAYTNKDTSHTSQIEKLISTYHIGGLIFFQDNPVKQAYMTNYYQSMSSTPLMIGIDGEWGLAMRLKSTFKFPYQVTLGSIQNDSLIYLMGAQMARQCKRIGIHVNFAPDIDVNNNPDNPIIGFRSFGENKYKVAKKGWMYASGMQSERVLACAKHYPGHGDVATDSHLDMPVVNKTRAEIDSLELYPFREIIKKGVAAIMVAHISFPQLDGRTNRSSSLSEPIVTGILKKEMNFNGLIFTDALNMKGVAKYFSPGNVEVEALLAGNDILVFPENVPLAVEKIKLAIKEGKITEAQIDERVKKILYWKEWAGLNNYKPVEIANIYTDLNPKASTLLNTAIAREAICVVKDENNLLPLQSKEKIACLTIGNQSSYVFNEKLGSFANSAHYSILKGSDDAKYSQIKAKLKAYQTIVISIHDSKIWNNKTFGFSKQDIDLINSLNSTHKVILVAFCNPYILKNFDKLTTVVIGYEDGSEFQIAAANVLSGKLQPVGTLPVSASPEFRAGMGLTSIKRQTLNNSGHFNSIGIDTNMLNKIDIIGKQIISAHAAPGCRIIVLKNGRTCYNKAFGYYTYDGKNPVTLNTVYDIASVSKIASTTLAVMKLYEEGKINLDSTLGTYLPQAKGTNKASLKIKDILTHQAGLTAWIPFYKETLTNFDAVYCKIADSAHTVKVTDNLFMLQANKDTILKRIFASQLESKVYRYSDLSMILMQQVIEKLTAMPLDQYVQKNFYDSMHLEKITYNPWKKYPVSEVAPTQNDQLFRKQLIQGYVHDPGAAMMGGVAGHAGVFSDAHDLATIMQMLNDGGVYNGTRYFKTATIEEFTKYHSTKSRRGLGFDKPDFSGKTSPASAFCSEETFGHTGFTGTCAWADPKYDLVFVFLSNRIYPDEENKNLINGSYRIKIQDIIYQSIGK